MSREWRTKSLMCSQQSESVCPVVNPQIAFFPGDLRYSSTR
jgi:hypothetical protein